MNKRPRRSFTPDEKVAVLKRHLVDRVAVSDLCDEYSLHPNQYYQWQKQFFEHGAAAFQPDRPTKEELVRRRRIEQLEAKLARKDTIIAEISEEYVQLKKELGEL